MNRLTSFLRPAADLPRRPHAGSPVDEKLAAIRALAARVGVAVTDARDRVEELTSAADPTADQVTAALAALDRAAAGFNDAERLWQMICPGQPYPLDLSEWRAEVDALLAALARFAPDGP